MCVTSGVRLPSASSLTPVTVTSCAVLQLIFVNVSVAGDTVAANVSELFGVTVTSPVGSTSSTTVYVASPAASATVRVVGDTVSPASSSVTVTATAFALVTE